MSATSTYILTIGETSEVFTGELADAIGHAQVIGTKHWHSTGQSLGVSVYAAELLGYVMPDGAFDRV